MTDSNGSAGVGDASGSVATLSWWHLGQSAWGLFRRSFRIVFRRKLWFMISGILAYYAILYAFAVYRPNEGFSVDVALLVLVEIPGTILAIYLAMDLVAKERNRNTLETLFSAASSHYQVWIVRLLAVYLVLAITLLAMSTISYFFFAEFPFVWGGLNAFIPAFFVANLTFFFSVFTRSANAAGMLALGFMWLVLHTFEDLRGTIYFLFLKPFDPPFGVNDFLWAEKVLINRLAIFGAGLLLLYSGLRRMEQREKLLA